MHVFEVGNSNISVKYLEETRVLLVIWSRTWAILWSTSVRLETVQTSVNILYRYTLYVFTDPLFLETDCLDHSVSPFHGMWRRVIQSRIFCCILSIIVCLNLRAAKSLTWRVISFLGRFNFSQLFCVHLWMTAKLNDSSRPELWFWMTSPVEIDLAHLGREDGKCDLSKNGQIIK